MDTLDYVVQHLMRQLEKSLLHYFDQAVSGIPSGEYLLEKYAYHNQQVVLPLLAVASVPSAYYSAVV